MAERRSVAVLVHRRLPSGEHQMLLLERAAWKGGGWQPVTGAVEDSDADAAAAAAREVFEETGLVVERVEDLGVESTFVGYDGVTYHERAFAAESASEDVRLDVEHVAYAWLPFPEARDRLGWPENRRALDALAERLTGKRGGDGRTDNTWKGK